MDTSFPNNIHFIGEFLNNRVRELIRQKIELSAYLRSK